MFGYGNKLQGAPHKVSVALGHEFNPSNRSIGLGTLCGCDERDEPVPIEEPARTEGLKTKVLHRGRGTLRGGLSRGNTGSRERLSHNP